MAGSSETCCRVSKAVIKDREEVIGAGEGRQSRRDSRAWGQGWGGAGSSKGQGNTKRTVRLKGACWKLEGVGKIFKGCQ